VGPNYYLSGPYVVEGNVGTTDAPFTLTLAQPSGVDLTFHYETADSTATAGTDYQAASGTLTIPAGQTEGTISVPVYGDTLPEPNETFFVSLSSPVDADLIMGSNTVTIADDKPHVRVGDVTVAEGNAGTAAATFAVTLDAPGAQPATVAYATGNCTAAAGGDYQVASGTLTFAPGETTKTVTIEVKRDGKGETDETFLVDLFGNTNNSLLLDGRGVGTILNDDWGGVPSGMATSPNSWPRPRPVTRRRRPNCSRSFMPSCARCCG
jgi:hypothetical protein